MSHASDLVQLLRNRVPMQSCDTCREDSACFVACGRGACSHEGKLMEQAADEIEKLSHGPSLPQGQRNAIIEECAKVVSTLYVDHYDHSAHKSAAKDIAHAIRGLKRHDATGSLQEKK